MKTDGWEYFTILKILFINKLLFENEDRLYPHGKGRTMLFEAIQDLHAGKTLVEIAKKYKLNVKKAKKLEKDMKNYQLSFFIR